MIKPGFIALLFALLLVVFAGFYNARHAPQNSPVTVEQNSKALIGGPFSLIDHHGKNVTEADYRGKYMLLYFGYSYCPDICPTELQIMAEALDLLPETVLSGITPLFITIDPQRDTVEVMARYVAAFHEKLVGLTGSEEQITAAKSAWRIYAAREKPPEGGDPAAYLMSHSSYVYLMDRNGEYVTHFSSGTNAKTMARRIEDIINGS